MRSLNPVTTVGPTFVVKVVCSCVTAVLAAAITFCALIATQLR